MPRKIWPFMLVGFAAPMISGCNGTIVPCTTFFGPPSQFQTVDFPDAAATIVTGINNAGEMVGYFADSRGMTSGFRGQNFLLSFVAPPLDRSAATSTEAYAINNRGNILITGHYPTGARSYLFNGTSFLPLPATGRPLDSPRGINDDPQVVGPGAAGLFGSVPQDYQYDVTNSHLSPVTIYENMPTFLTGIDNHGRMVGSVQKDLFTTQAFYMATPDVTSPSNIDFSGVGAVSSVVNGINNASDPGCIKHVGTYWKTDNVPHGFVHLQAGGLATVDVRDAVQTQAFGINDNGDIVGSYQDKAGKTHGFLAPDP